MAKLVRNNPTGTSGGRLHPLSLIAVLLYVIATIQQVQSGSFVGLSEKEAFDRMNGFVEYGRRAKKIKFVRLPGSTSDDIYRDEFSMSNPPLYHKPAETIKNLVGIESNSNDNGDGDEFPSSIIPYNRNWPDAQRAVLQMGVSEVLKCLTDLGRWTISRFSRFPASCCALSLFRKHKKCMQPLPPGLPKPPTPPGPTEPPKPPTPPVEEPRPPGPAPNPNRKSKSTGSSLARGDKDKVSTQKPTKPSGKADKNDNEENEPDGAQ